MSRKKRLDELREAAAALGPWFHNIDLGGVMTAPDHFLGDYPAVKWRRFAHAIPADLSGKTVLDIGCNAGFYSIQMKLRNAARVLAIDLDPDYLRQARFAAETIGVNIEFAEMSAYDIGLLGERFDIVLFLGVLYHLRHPLLALDLIREHVVRDIFVCQSMQRGEPGEESTRRGLPILREVDFRSAELSAVVLHRAPVCRGRHQLVGPEPRLHGGDAAQRRFSDRSQSGGGGIRLPADPVADRLRCGLSGQSSSTD